MKGFDVILLIAAIPVTIVIDVSVIIQWSCNIVKFSIVGEFLF